MQVKEKKYFLECWKCNTKIIYKRSECKYNGVYGTFHLTCPSCHTDYSSELRELFNREYEEEKDLEQEIERLNNIINGIEEHLKSEIKIGNKVWSETQNREERMQTGLIKNTLELTLDKLQELKGENK